MIDYIYMISVVDSSEEYPGKDMVGLYTEDSLPMLQAMVESNAADYYEGCFDYVFIDKISLNKAFPFPKERYIYKYTGENSYKLFRVESGTAIVERILENRPECCGKTKIL